MLLSFSMVRRGKPLAPRPFPRRRQGRGQAGVSSFSVLLPNGLALGPLGQGGGHRVHRLGGGEAVSVTLPDPEPVDVAPQDIPLDVVYEDGDVIGFVLMEDGEEAEYYYVEEDEEEAEEEDNPYDLGITKEGVAEATNDMNAIYKDGIAVAAELKGAFDDIKSALDFTSFLKK